MREREGALVLGLSLKVVIERDDALDGGLHVLHGGVQVDEARLRRQNELALAVHLEHACLGSLLAHQRLQQHRLARVQDVTPLLARSQHVDVAATEPAAPLRGLELDDGAEVALGTLAVDEAPHDAVDGLGGGDLPRVLAAGLVALVLGSQQRRASLLLQVLPALAVQTNEG